MNKPLSPVAVSIHKFLQRYVDVHKRDLAREEIMEILKCYGDELATEVMKETAGRQWIEKIVNSPEFGKAEKLFTKFFPR